MPKKKTHRPSYFNQGKRMDPQMMTRRFAELLSAGSLAQLKTVIDKQGRKNEKTSN